MIGKLMVLSAFVACCSAIDYFRPEPYAFGYDVKDPHAGVKYRHEKSDGKGHVKGSYGYTDPFGIFRVVDYVADHFGYRAKIRTNEPGTANQNPAFVDVYSKGGNFVPLLSIGKVGHGVGYHHGPGPLLHRGVITGAKSGLHSAIHAKHVPHAGHLGALGHAVAAKAAATAPAATHAAATTAAGGLAGAPPIPAKALAAFKGFPLAALLGGGAGKGHIAPIAPIAPVHFG